MTDTSKEIIDNRIKQYWQRLKDRYNFNDSEDQTVLDILRRDIYDGFTFEEAFLLTSYTEHVQPELSEKAALIKMRKIIVKAVKEGRFKRSVNCMIDTCEDKIGSGNPVNILQYKGHEVVSCNVCMDKLTNSSLFLAIPQNLIDKNKTVWHAAQELSIELKDMLPECQEIDRRIDWNNPDYEAVVIVRKKRID